MPLLTPSQFARTAAAKKPGATYQSYKTYVLNTRQRRANARAADPLSSFLQTYQSQLLSPAQQAAAARAQVNSQIATSLAGMRASTRAAQAQANRQALRAQGFSQALARDTAGDPAALAGQYRASADMLKGLGTGLTAEVQAAQQKVASDQAAKIAALGAPELPAANDPAAIRSALQYSGVVLPAGDLAGQAANAYALASGNRAAQITRQGEVAQGFLQKGTDLQAQLANERSQLESTRPSLLQSALASQRGDARQNMAALVSALALQNTTRQTTASINQGYTKAGATKQTADTGTSKVTGIGKNGEILPGFYPQTKNGKTHVSKIPAGYTYNWTTGKLVKTPAGAGGKGAVTGTANAKNVQALIKSAQGVASKAVLQAPYAQKDPFGFDPPKPLMPYAKAKQRLLQAYFPKLYWTNPRVVAMVEDLLGTAGYKKPAVKTTAKAASGKPLP